jgi:L-Ala-D/L-Glu epimerase / N-acetyl-D-glutamate racemase
VKIESFDIQPLNQRQDDPSWSFALATYPVIEGWLITLSAEGATGRGYAQAIPHMGSSSASVRGALELFKPKVIGRSPLDIDPILADLEPVLAGNAQAKAGLDCALHDLAATLLKVPVHALLGGAFRRSIPQIRIVPIKAPTEMAAEARKLVDKGYRALKIKLKGQVRDDVARVKAIREAVGGEILLTLDPNQSYRAKDAIAALERMEPYDVRLVEQPVAASDLKGLELITKTVPQIVEADESAVTLQDVSFLAANRIVDAVSLKIPKMGGLRNTMLAAQICHHAGIEYRVGATFGPRLMAAHAAHLAAALPRLALPCELAEFDHLRDDPFEGLEVDNGMLAVPATAGSGVRLK